MADAHQQGFQVEKLKMAKLRSLEEFLRGCVHIEPADTWRWLCADCAHAYAEQEVTSQRIQLAALIHLLERVRDAEDPEEYLDDVAAVDESNLADEVRVFFQERDALLAVVRASIVSKAVGVLQCKICGHTWLSSNDPWHYKECPVAHPAVHRLLKETK